MGPLKKWEPLGHTPASCGSISLKLIEPIVRYNQTYNSHIASL